MKNKAEKIVEKINERLNIVPSVPLYDELVGIVESNKNRGYEFAFNGAMAGWQKESAQHSAHLTALRRWLAVSLLFNVVLLAVVLFTIGGR